MQREMVALSPGDREILESYRLLIGGLADYLGGGFEIVLHSLEDLDQSVIAIINGHYTGRTVGAPVTDLALDMLSKIESEDGRNHISYFNRNKKGEPLKSTTIAIRGAGRRAIGLLCINFYLDIPLSRFLSHWMPAGLNHMEEIISENLSDNAEELIHDALLQASARIYGDSGIPASNRNREIISILAGKGVFNLKNAVQQIADSLGISKNTVYMHLRNLVKNDE